MDVFFLLGQAPQWGFHQIAWILLLEVWNLNLKGTGFSRSFLIPSSNFLIPSIPQQVKSFLNLQYLVLKLKRSFSTMLTSLQISDLHADFYSTCDCCSTRDHYNNCYNTAWRMISRFDRECFFWNSLLEIWLPSHQSILTWSSFLGYDVSLGLPTDFANNSRSWRGHWGFGKLLKIYSCMGQ